MAPAFFFGVGFLVGASLSSSASESPRVGFLSPAFFFGVGFLVGASLSSSASESPQVGFLSPAFFLGGALLLSSASLSSSSEYDFFFNVAVVLAFGLVGSFTFSLATSTCCWCLRTTVLPKWPRFFSPMSFPKLLSFRFLVSNGALSPFHNIKRILSSFNFSSPTFPVRIFVLQGGVVLRRTGRVSPRFPF